VFVVRGVDPGSISAIKSDTANTRNVYFNPINISDSDYVLCVGTTGSNSLQPNDSFSISSGYIDSVSMLNDIYTGIDTRSAAILRKPGTSGAYTEPTWTHPSSGSADSSCGCVIKLSPL
jgi:PPE-repeat protein